MTHKTLLLFIIPSLVLSTLTHASDARREAGGAEDPMRRAQLMIRKLSQQKAALEAEKTQLQMEVQTLTGEVESLGAKVEKTELALDQTKDRNSELVDRIKGDVEKYKELLSHYRDTVATLRAANSDNAHLVKAVNERSQWIDQCNQQNQEMFQANIDLLDRYQNKSAWDSISESEQLTGIASVDLENQVQEYQFRLEDLLMPEFRASGDYQAHVRNANDATVVAN